jgi:molybdopterin-binding protein
MCWLILAMLILAASLITSSITNESVDDLGLKVGGSVYVVIKASDVMIGVD